jgi:hypothetical protein
MQDEHTDHRIQLYGMLVEQIQKYNDVVWQFPTALLAVNLLAVDKLFGKPWALASVSLFNFGLIYAFYRMVVTQGKIIETAKEAEAELKLTFNKFVPKFNKTTVSGRWLAFWALLLLNGCLLGCSVLRIWLALHPACRWLLELFL